MANKLQKLIYNLSIISPLCLTFALLWYIQEGTVAAPIICTALGIFLGLCFLLSFSYGKRHVASMMIRVTNLSPRDGWVAAYILTYISPFTSMVIRELDVVICGFIAIVLVAVILFSNSATPNPLLCCAGYHFYEISAENGVSGYLLISRRKLRNTKEIKTVKRVFEFLLIDSEG